MSRINISRKPMLGHDEKRCLQSTEKNAALYIDHAALYIDHAALSTWSMSTNTLFYWSTSTTALFLIDVNQTAVFYWSTVDAVNAVDQGQALLLNGP